VVLKNWYQSYQDSTFAVVSELRRNEIDLYSMILICGLFWVPNNVTTITPADANYHFQNNNVNPNAGNVAVSYNEKFLGQGQIDINREIKLPVGWWIIFKVTKGTVYQLKDWTSLDDSLGQVLRSFSSAKIKDSVLKSEVNQFHTACYSRTLAKHQTSSFLPVGAGTADVSWIGSEYFLNTEGYYGHCSAASEAAGECVLPTPYWMPYQISNRYGIETGREADGTLNPRPSCKDWWEGTNPSGGGGGEAYGLKSRLLDELSFIRPDFLISNEAQNAGIKRLLRNDQPTISYIPELDNGEGEKGFMAKMLDAGTGFVGGMGAQIASWIAQFTLKTLIPMLPMVQAVILLGMIISLAVVQIVSAFSVQVTVLYIFAFITVLSWTFWWHIAFLLDEGLLNFMYPDATSGDAALRSFTGSTQDVIWTIVSAMTYILLPGIWSFMLGVAGVRSMNTIANTMNDAKSQSSGIGSSSGGLVGKSLSGLGKGK